MNKKPQDIEDIEKRINTLRGKDTAPKEKNYISAYQVGSRIAAELVSGVIVGGGLGYLFDKLLKTPPILLIVFLIMGSIAGFRNVYKYVKEEETKEEEK